MPTDASLRPVLDDGPAEVGIIGLGQFGRFAAAHLAPHVEVIGHDPVVPHEPIARVELGTLAEAAGCEFVLLTVPVQALRGVLDDIGPYLQTGACVLDACSVKMAPMEWMAELLPPDVDFLGTHPLFGPRSAGNDLEGHRVVLCPGRGPHTECVAEFLQDLGLYVIVTDPETHDRESARAQALSQYVGRGLAAIEATDSGVATCAADLLREVEEIVSGDSWELFAAIQQLNPFAAEVRAQLRASLDAIDARLEES